MRPWGYTLSCSSQPCTASVTLSSPRNGYLWQRPTRSLARMPKLSWVTVSPGLSPQLTDFIVSLVSQNYLLFTKIGPFEVKKCLTQGECFLICCMCLTDATYLVMN